jgi:hypothetical protein
MRGCTIKGREEPRDQPGTIRTAWPAARFPAPLVVQPRDQPAQRGLCDLATSQRGAERCKLSSER